MEKIMIVSEGNTRDFLKSVETALNEHKGAQLHIVDLTTAYITYKEVTNARKTTRPKLSSKTDK